MTKRREATAYKNSSDANIGDLDKIDDAARTARLKFLIEKSKIYTSILSEKLFSQQATLKARGGSSTSSTDDSISTRSSTASNLANSTSSHARKSSSRQESEVEKTLDPLTVEAANGRQPELITGGTLRDYQLAGVEWMVSLYENGLNGILADEMGLGKTLQTIAFLAFLRSKGVVGPFLIVAPLSTLYNWVSEVQRFAPSIPVLLYHGSKLERADLRANKLGKIDDNFPIVVTSYEIVMNDRKFLQKYTWKYIIVDEGHRLKNLNCRLIRELKSYTSANRLLLTGTPLQNNLSELWSLLNFLLPDIFSDLESFQAWFDFSAMKGDDDGDEKEVGYGSVISSLHQILKPFLLRRLKTDVERNLPRKREYLLFAPMTKQQADLYKAILAHKVQGYYDEIDIQKATRKHKLRDSAANESEATPSKRRRTHVPDYKEEDDDCSDFEEVPKSKTYPTEVMDQTHQGQSRSHLKLRNMLMSLRKACNHPYQMDWPVKRGTDELKVDDNIVQSSGKMKLLKRLLVALFEAGHKVLIFSQFTTMLDIIEAWSEDIMSYRTFRIDGTVDQESRKTMIKDFNANADCRLFLLSTRAGGLGINLTSADTVILFDSDWNPQSDLQAMDRVHRIGQVRPVIVYRFVSKNTVESKILERANFKRRLEKVVIQKGAFKSLASSQIDALKDDLDDLDRILSADDAAEIDIMSKDDEIISDEDLSLILDRSSAAYEQHGKQGSTAFQSYTPAVNVENDSLATSQEPAR